MKYFSKNQIENLPRIFRLNLINSSTGYKSANLIGTKSNRGNTNLAIFSSVTHLGSDPALISITLRPKTVSRHTYENMIETKVFTVNHISEKFIADAHHTSAKYPKNFSEFDQTKLEPEYKKNFYPPYVKGAPVQLGCKFINEYYIKENDCSLVIASIDSIFVNKEIIKEDGWLQLDKGKVVTVNGLDGYALPKLKKRLQYARPKKDNK